MTARERILGRIRHARADHAPQPRSRFPRSTAPGPADSEETANAVDEHPAPPLPALARTQGPERIAQFTAKAEAADATVSRIADWDALPAALGHEVRARNLPAAIRTGTDPAFERDWPGIERSVGPGRLEEPAALSRAAFGIAETGSVVLLSGPANPVTLTFLAETHFVALDVGDVAAGYEELWARLRGSGADSRTVTLVTGPSRSADIGQTLQLGAHGPLALHIFLIG